MLRTGHTGTGPARGSFGRPRVAGTIGRRSAIGTGYGRQHDRICDRCDLADERMSAKGQTVGSVRLGAATGPVSMKTINSWPSVVGRDPMLRKNDGGLLCFRSAVAISLSFSRLSKRLHRRPLYLRGKV